MGDPGSCCSSMPCRSSLPDQAQASLGPPQAAIGCRVGMLSVFAGRSADVTASAGAADVAQAHADGHSLQQQRLSKNPADCSHGPALTPRTGTQALSRAGRRQAGGCRPGRPGSGCIHSHARPWQPAESCSAWPALDLRAGPCSQVWDSREARCRPSSRASSVQGSSTAET